MSRRPKTCSLQIAVLVLAGCLLFHPLPLRALMEITPGDAPPPFSLSDTSGTAFSLEHFQEAGGVIIFWSTWSPRSGEILEDFRTYHEELAPQGLKVLAINVDGENLDSRRRGEIKRYLEEKDLPFPVLLDGDLEAFAAYGVMAHPSSVVIGRDGRITYTLGGYPLSLREELKDHVLKVLGLYVEPEPPEVPSVGYVPANRALQHYNMGRHLMNKGQPERALAAFRRARERDPSFLDPAVMIARLSLIEGDVEEAESVLRSADPALLNRDDLRFLLGYLMLVKGSEEKAEKAFLNLQRRSPESGWGLWGLGLVALSLDDAGGALEKMEAASALTPRLPEAEARVRTYLVGIWMRGDSAPREEGFLALFPSLTDLRDRYRKLFNQTG